MARPLLDDVELQQVQEIETEQDQVLVQHGVPALEGDFLQRVDRRATQVTLTGVLTGPEVTDGLKTLREKFRAAEPVPFVVDITTATKVDQVLIEEMGVRELAGKPERFEYAFTLREFIAPPAEETEEPPIPPEEPPDPEVATLEVEVIVEGDPSFDFSTTTVTVEGTQEEGDAPLSRTLTNRTNNVWREESVPPGSYSVRAVTGTEPALTGTVEAVVRVGQTTQVQIVLSRSRPANVAVAFVVHFRFDRAFVEPCMRPVLRQVAQYASNHSDEKLIILGHTDKVGDDPPVLPLYNQSLSERRARAVFAYLTFGRDAQARASALAEWDQLRQTRPTGTRLSINDSWGVYEYQHILQDLGFYPGAVDGDDKRLTQEAVRAYRCHKGLPPGTNVDADVWRALIEDYLTQDNLAIPADNFLPNCDNEIIKWLGCGEEDPVRNTPNAWRPNRRTELLFVRTNSLPCQVPQPDTFNLPAPGAVNSNWCVGPVTGSDHSCFVTIADLHRTPPPARDPNAFTRTPAEPGTFTVEGSIQRELPNGTLQPVPSQPFVLITPIGEFKRGEQSNGEPTPARTDANGRFSFSDLPAGFYSLEVVTRPNQPVLIRLLNQPNARLTGNMVCTDLHAPPGGANPRLDVVIVNAPVLREIRLPVVAHLMTPLDGTSAAIRTCPNPANPGNTLSQATARADNEIRELFEEANKIWRQARIRFDPLAIVRSAYIHPIVDPIARGSCEVDNDESKLLLRRCAYPDVINIFFFGDLQGTGTGGRGVSPENAAADSLPGGGFVADRFQAPFGGGLVVNTLTRQQSIRVLAHVLGQFLNLAQVADTPANADRLMRSTTTAGTNTTLVDDEVARAHSSQAAMDNCVPLSLTVTGATQIGGILSSEYIFVQDRELIDPFDITIDAQIPDHLLVNGTLSMTDGTNTIIGNQITVSKVITGETTVTATYTPTGGGQPVSRHVAIRVATFTLRVEGATPISPGSNSFVTTPHPTDVVTVIADIDPTPFCAPRSLVTWNGGNETPDPLRQTVSRVDSRPTTITATIAGQTRSVTISVVRVLTAMFTTRQPPFTTAIDQVQIEGILNTALASFDTGDLFANQPDSLFRVRADINGFSGNNVPATLISIDNGGAHIESRDITLTRRFGGNRFVSDPILAVSAAIPRADVNATDLEFIRAQAGGRIRLALSASFGFTDLVQVRVRGRVAHVSVLGFIESGISEVEIRREIASANRVWAQAGVEVRIRRVIVPVNSPPGLADLDTFAFRTPFTGTLTAEERQFLGIDPGGPVRSANANDMNVYYVRSFTDPDPARPVPPQGAIAYARESYSAIDEPDHSAIGIVRTLSDTALGHELGHHFLRGWPGDEHANGTLPGSPAWPRGNVMHATDFPNNLDLDQTQVVNVLNAASGNTHPVIRFTP